MKIALASDVHLEFGDHNISNDTGCDTLILSGDICVAKDLNKRDPLGILENAKSERFVAFFERCAAAYANVIYIMGNHEHYHGDFKHSIGRIRESLSHINNLHILDKECVTIDDITFVGGTLWTDMNKEDESTLYTIRGVMNDFRIVRNEKREYAAMSALDVAIRHDKTLGYIKHIVQEHKDKKCVVVGHHAPSFKSVHEQYASQTLMNGGYASDLSEFILDHPQIKLWTHGHMHQPFDYVIGETRVVCNPRGYESDGYSENSGWNPNILLEI